MAWTSWVGGACVADTGTCFGHTRFAVKEAVFKAHPFLHLGFHDVVIARQGAAHRGGREGEEEEEKETANGSGPPVAFVGGEDGQMAQVSISHDGDYTTAVCLGFDSRGGR